MLFNAGLFQMSAFIKTAGLFSNLRPHGTATAVGCLTPRRNSFGLNLHISFLSALNQNDCTLNSVIPNKR